MRASFHAASITTTESSVRVVDDIADLVALFDGSVNVVRLRRTLSPNLVDECRRASDEVCFRKLFTLAPGESVAHALSQELPGFPLLAADLRLWVEVLAELTGSERVGVRLTRVESAMCPRFHVDRVMLRLVSTYVGRGTEYVANEEVDRRRLGHPAADNARTLLHDSDSVCAATAGDIVFLKGELWPENAGQGAVHRSPAASVESPRLVLTLDPL